MNEVSKPVLIVAVVLVIALVGGLGWYFMNQGSAAQASARPKPPPWMELGPDGSFRPKGGGRGMTGSSPAAGMRAPSGSGPSGAPR